MSQITNGVIVGASNRSRLCLAIYGGAAIANKVVDYCLQPIVVKKLPAEGDVPRYVLNYLNSNREGENKFDKMQKWDTTPEQDAKAKNAADSYIKEDYSLLGHNCYQLGVTMFEILGIPIDPGPHPNNSFWDNNEKYGAEIINILE